jgi:hypothetical protein
LRSGGAIGFDVGRRAFLCNTRCVRAKSRALKKKSTRSQKTFSPTEPPIPDAALCTGNQTSFSISYTREATMSVGERRLRLLRRQISRAEFVAAASRRLLAGYALDCAQPEQMWTTNERTVTRCSSPVAIAP